MALPTSYANTLPQTKALVASGQLRNVFNEIKTHFATTNPLGLIFPSSVASAAQYMGLLLNSGKTGFDFSHVFRTSAAMNFTGTPISGQLLQFTGANACQPVTIYTGTAPEVKTGDFNTAANATYQVSTGVNTITLHAPAGVGEQFSIMPKLGTRSFASSIPALAGAMQVNGATIDANYLNQDVKYNFISMDGTNWWVSGEPFDV